MLLGGSSAWARSQLKESTAGYLGKGETEEALVGVTAKTSLMRGFCHIFLGAALS